MKPSSKIKNWGIYRVGEKVKLYGDAIDHHRIGDMVDVTTTSVIAIHKEINKVETRNTMYTLIGRGKCQLEADDPVIQAPSAVPE